MSMVDDETNDEQKNPIYLFIKYSILLICIFVTSYRIFVNYNTYCEYKMLINSKVELSENETLPQLSICFYEVINDNKLNEFSEALAAEYQGLSEDPSRYDEWKEKFTLKELFDLSFNYEDYFINCTFLDQDAIKELNCSEFYTITLSAKKKCFNFFHRTKEENELDDQWIYNRILLQNRPWVRIFVSKANLKYKKRMDIVINPYFSLPNTDKSNPGFKSYTTDYTQSIFVSYDCRKSKRLPDPYETHCINYAEIGYFDRQHCIYECKAFEFLRNQGGWTEDLTVNHSFAEQIDQMNMTLHYATDLVNDCEKNEKKCKRLDCMSKEYTIINKYHKLNVDKQSSEIEVRLYLNSAPTTSLEYEELYTLSSSFVQLFIGPASLWLGLSIYSLTKLALWFLCEVTNQKAKKRYKPPDQAELRKSTRLGNTAITNSHLNDDNSIYRSFALDNSLAKSIYNADFTRRDHYPSGKLFDNPINRSIDNCVDYFNKTPKFVPNQIYANSINSISGELSPLVYKASLEMYSKKALKIKPTNQAKNTVNHSDETNDSRGTMTSYRQSSKERSDDKSIATSIQANGGWILKFAEQKSKCINYLFKSSQVYPK